MLQKVSLTCQEVATGFLFIKNATPQRYTRNGEFENNILFVAWKELIAKF
jgi:hypothetical protein